MADTSQPQKARLLQRVTERIDAAWNEHAEDPDLDVRMAEYALHAVADWIEAAPERERPRGSVLAQMIREEASRG